MSNRKNKHLQFPLFISFFLLLFTNHLSAQVPTVQDCLGAIPICTEIYTETNAPTGAGNYLNEINGTSQGGISCMDEESNSIWYTFTTNQSGNFGFTLTPNNASDDYDWAMFNITGKSCGDIFNDPSCQVSCNASGGSSCNGPTGANGLSSYDNQGANCNNFPPTQFAGNSPNNALVPVAQGNTYVLVVSNWTGSPFGYTIDFGVSTDIGIIDNIFPEIADVNFPPDCGGQNIEVNFSENIQCNTIDGDNFQITGPGGPYDISLTSLICGQGGEYTDVFSLSVNPPMWEVGEYTLTLVSNQSTEVLDLCDNPSSISSFTYEIINSPLQLLNLGDDALLCDGEVLNLNAFYPNADSYLWQNGSTNSSFQVTQSGNYSVTVTNTCNTVVDNINVQILPIQTVEVDLGNDTTLCLGDLYELDATWNSGSIYTWQDGFDGAVYTVSSPGIYEVQIEGFCGETGTVSVEINYESPLSLELGNDTILCDGEMISFDVEQPFVNSYVWQDGSTNPTFTPTQTGNVSVTIESNCMTLTDDIFVDFVPMETINVDLGNDTSLCSGDLYELDATWSAGSIYTWQDGFDGAVYTVSEPGIYEVQIQGYCGGMGTASVAIDYELPLSLELGNDTTLCEGEILSFDVEQPFVNSYVWQDGSTNPIFEATQTGNVSVSIESNCMTLTDEVFINFVPTEIFDVDLGNDTILCLGEFVQLDATWINGLTYLWQDSSTQPVYTVAEPGFYEVQVEGICGEMGIAMIEVLYDSTELRLDLGVDTVVCEEDGIYVLDALDLNAENYYWSDSSVNSFLRIEEKGIYSVTISDACNVLTDEIAVNFTNCTICEVFVPNAFSPDFNGYNDNFRPYSNCDLLNFSMKVFNRWGALVFETSNEENGWDGTFNNKTVTEGVYVYLMEFEVNQMGVNLKRKRSGDVTVTK